VTGDAHKLSSYFDTEFDFIYTTAVLGHLAMPWIVAVEIAELRKISGYLMVETHFSFSAHERPWDFFVSAIWR
jgi:2-polyprenyl-3-methyl-5-hydroxy-6-metoxy-1,4-benzoquinol methylase